jgi:hypothetical protein
MGAKRFYVYLSSCQEVKLERQKLENCLLALDTFPWSLHERRSSLNTALVRRQIDDSDYLVFLLGARYGDLSATGLSYLHLDFLYALNKGKTIISLLDKFPEKRGLAAQDSHQDLISKYAHFRQLLLSESQYTYEFSTLFDLESAMRRLFAQARKSHPKAGWLKASEPQSLEPILTLPSATTPRQSAPPSMTACDAETQVGENENFAIRYHAHAYQDGNLQDIRPQRQLGWLQILEILSGYFQSPTIESNFARALNQYLERTALPDARQVLPRAHAVARTQIDEQCLQEIKRQMQGNNWIIPTTHHHHSSAQVYWTLTAEAKKLLNAS